MNKLVLVSLSSIIFLSSCSNRFEQPHPNVDNARLRLVSIPSNNNFISSTISDDCVADTSDIPDRIATLGAKANLVRSLSRIGMPDYNSEISDSHQSEIYIPVNGQNFSFQFNGVGITGFAPGKSNSSDGILYSWCQKVVSFTPIANANYEALYDYVEFENGKKTCGVKLFEIVENTPDSYSKIEVENYQVIENYCK
jgi:hypothetical protein